MSLFQSVHRVVHLLRGLPVTSLLFNLIQVACGMFLVITWVDVCLTAVLQTDKLLFTKKQLTSHRQQAHGNWLR